MAADIDCDGRLNRAEFEHFYRQWSEKFIGRTEGVCVLENGSDFFDKYYKLLNMHDTSAEGVSYNDYLSVTQHISKDRYEKPV